MDANWRKSTRSGGNGQCVEARCVERTAQVRDSKDREGPVLSFIADQWVSFVQDIKAGNLEA